MKNHNLIAITKLQKSFKSFSRFTLITGLFLFGASVNPMQAQQNAQASEMVTEADTSQNSFAWLQLEEQHLDRVIENFAHALHSDNQGVREAAIFHSFLLQLHFPDKQMSELEEAMFELSQTEREPRIRHKASIALYFFQDSSAELREELDEIPDGSRTESRLYQQALQVMNGRLFSDSSSSGLSF